MEKAIPLKNAVIVPHVTMHTSPSDKLFAERGEKFVPGKMPWQMEKYTGKNSDDAALIRMDFTVPEDGCYSLNCGADWYLSIYVDKGFVRSFRGFTPPKLSDHKCLVELKKGKHVLELNFARGRDSAQLVFSITKSDKKLSGIPFGVDLEKKIGSVNRKLHGANTTLILSSRNMKQNQYDKDLRRLNFTFARTHDWPLWNAGQRIIDTHFIFPLMHLDAKDPRNYYFKATDEILRLTQEEAEMEVFYRLGTSIEHSGKKHFNTIPPDDNKKYAEILAGIIRHYTKGWAEGFRYKIRYWEIWNEPEGGDSSMWQGPYKETFIPFFVTVLKHLKKEFPELKIGGPAFCYANQELILQLLDACRKAGVAPDFISWHAYTADPATLIREPVRIRALLDEQGFKKTELCINEWHYLTGWGGVQSFRKPEEYLESRKMLHGIDAGVFNTAVISGWQYGPLDSAMWYGSCWDSAAWGYRNICKQYTKNYYSLELVGRFLKNYSEKCKAESRGYLFLLAGTSKDGKKAGILVSDFKGGPSDLKIPVKGIEKYPKISAVILDENRNNEPVKVSVQNGNLILKKAGHGSAAFLVSLESGEK